MGHRVRNYPASPYPRPSARAVTEASRVRVSGWGSGLQHGCVVDSCARRWQALALIPLQHPTEARVVVFLRPGHPKLVTSKTPAVTLAREGWGQRGPIRGKLFVRV